MLYLIGGLAILGGLLLLLYVFVNADPAKLARGGKWALIGIAIAVALFLLLSDQFRLLWLPIAIGLPAWRRYRALFSKFGGFSRPSTGRSSDAETPYLRMSLDHDTGTMTGTVLSGSFAGMRLEEMTRADLIALLRECRTGDEEGARLVEAYLDRAHPDWRDDLGGADGGPRRPSGPDMSVDEAYAILGLAPGATKDAVREAHHRLMKQFHPDHGGSDYLAGKINRARDVLLGQR